MSGFEMGVRLGHRGGQYAAQLEADGALALFYHDWRDGECIHPDDGPNECEAFADAYRQVEP